MGKYELSLEDLGSQKQWILTGPAEQVKCSWCDRSFTTRHWYYCKANDKVYCDKCSDYLLPHCARDANWIRNGATITHEHFRVHMMTRTPPKVAVQEEAEPQEAEV